MGFDSCIKTLPKINGEFLEIKDALHAYHFCKFLKWTESDWCKKQIEKGYKFNFEESYPMYKGMSHKMSVDVLNFYTKVIEAEENNPDDDYIADWCSAGRYIHDLIRENSHAVMDGSYDDYYEISKLDISNIEKAVDEWEDDHKIIPVTATYGIKCNDDNSITCVPIDGIEVETEDGFVKKIYNGETELFISSKYCDTDERYAYNTLKVALQKMKNVDSSKYYIYYLGGC